MLTKRTRHGDGVGYPSGQGRLESLQFRLPRVMGGETCSEDDEVINQADVLEGPRLLPSNLSHRLFLLCGKRKRENADIWRRRITDPRVPHHHFVCTKSWPKGARALSRIPPNYC